MSNILSSLKSPDMINNLSENEKVELCTELRKRIIETVSETGGHLASNLGVIELTVALLSGLLYIEKAIGKRSPQIKFTVQKNLAMVRDLRSQADANGLIVKNISTHIVIAKDGTEATVIKVLFAMHSNQAALEEYCESFSNREGVLKVEKVHFRDVTSE